MISALHQKVGNLIKCISSLKPQGKTKICSQPEHTYTPSEENGLKEKYLFGITSLRISRERMENHLCMRLLLFNEGIFNTPFYSKKLTANADHACGTHEH